MITLTVKDQQLTKKYSTEELNYLFVKFVEFLKTQNETVNLYEVDYDNLSEKTKKKYDTIKNSKIEDLDLVNI